MAGIPFLHNIDLNENQLLNAKLHTSGTAPSSPGTGTIWYDSTNDKVKVYDTDAWYTVGNTTAEIEDIAGGLFTGNTETGITATYQTGDNTIDLVTDVTLTNTATLTNKSLTAPILTGSSSSAGSILFKEDTDNGTNTVTLIGPASTADVIVTLPAATDTLIGKATTDTLTNKTLTSPILTSPALGTPASGVMTNVSGTAAALTAGAVTSIGNLTGDVTSTNRATTIAADAVHATMINNDLISGSASALTSGLASTDEFLISDAGTLKNMDVSVLQSYLQSNLTFTTNTNTGVDMTTTTLKTKLAGGFPSNAVTIGDSDDVVTIGQDLIVTGDLTVSGDTITANVETLNVEDKNITLNYHASNDTSSTAGGSGITIQDAVNASTDATILWDTSNDEFDFSHAINVTGNITVSGTVDGIDIATDVAANTAKVTNVTTNLGITGTNAARTITSSDGTDAIIPVATTSVSGVMSAAQVTALNAAQTAGEVGTLIDARSSAHTITGDNSETEFTITYGFTAAAVNDVMIQVVCSYATDTDHDGDTVYTETERHSTTQCKIKFATAPGTGHTYRVLCFKIA